MTAPARAGDLVVDVRPVADFVREHLVGALFVGFGIRLATASLG